MGSTPRSCGYCVTAFAVGFDDGWALFTSTRRLPLLGRALDDALNSAVFGAQQVLGGPSLGASDESFSEICCKPKAAKNNRKELNHVWTFSSQGGISRLTSPAWQGHIWGGGTG
jgi:hypothetical protein